MPKKIESGADSLRTIADIVAVLGAFAVGLPLFLALADVISWGLAAMILACGVVAIFTRFILVALAACAEAAALYIARHSDPEE